MGLFSFSWLRKPNAPTPELIDQVAAAEAELDRAQSARAEAQSAFTLDGSETAVKKLLAADEAVAVASKHVERAKELHRLAVERDEQERLAKLQSELDASIVAVKLVRAEAEPLVAKEEQLERELEAIQDQRRAINQRADVLVPRVQKAHFALHKDTHFPRV